MYRLFNGYLDNIWARYWLNHDAVQQWETVFKLECLF